MADVLLLPSNLVDRVAAPWIFSKYFAVIYATDESIEHNFIGIND